ncbi:NADPH-dependent assimilatory sulfite reductase hemoprotein subunit [Verrucomicrobia bacterium]|jgi:sulfite reductase (NADPH) hemoprotein beta-component|nr:NADPH-dependent assimilatory sulfite reductase hemoprotein subunit [Verrucomicrobiota bacterium]MDB4777302.1 NADPH-dependent assimilatory sulfite reductase hemoprotein subunit [Verrucomicrobiota bacterium]
MIKPASEKKLSHNEILKENDPLLAGNLAATLNDPEVDRFSKDDGQFLKFHGIYQQDDRDKRKTGKHYMFMIRGRIASGIMAPDQYRVYDDLATNYANNTLRLTSRQSIQFHGVVKTGLGPLMKTINEALMTTLAACGDVNRNVMASPTPATDAWINKVHEDSELLSNALQPTTQAYHSIWVEGVQLDLEEHKDHDDPLYGKTYLPRKFKTAFAIPPLNDVDLFTNCLGFVAIAENDKLVGYNLTAGGGLGMSHNNPNTFPRKADVIGYIARDQIENVAKGVLTIHRDFGDRTDRKHARLKYVLEEKGVEWFRNELEKRIGFKLEDAKPFEFTRQGDRFGWHKQADGNHFLGLFVEAGRIKDTDSIQLKTAIRKVVDSYNTEIRLTPTQNILIVNVTPESVEGINKILADHGVQTTHEKSPVRSATMACPALPTCGLALAESERYLPGLIDRVEGLLGNAGIPQEEIIIRMTGCPNGCARPYMAELAFVGRAPKKYNVYVGGNESGTRLNRLYKVSVKDDEMDELLGSLLHRFKGERQTDERFGDWSARALWKELDEQEEV